MTIGFNPGFIAQVFNRCFAAATHIMAKTQGMSNFMRGNKTDQLTHQFIIKFHFSGFGINRCSLNHIPVMNQFHHIMVPADMAFQDLTTARVMYLRTIRVFNIRSEIADYRVTGIFQTHIRIIYRPFFTNDRIFKTRFFKSFLPVVDTINQRFNPLFWGSGINIINDLFGGFHQFTTLIFLHILRFRLQSPANGESLVFYFLLIITIHNKAVSKITNTGIKQTTVHRYLRQNNHRSIQLKCNNTRV